MKMTLNLILLNIFLFFITISAQLNYTKEKISILEQFMNKSPKELFKVWHFIFGKKYTFDSEEAKQRFVNFKENLAIIKKTNEENYSFKLGLNQFSDMTNEEFKSKMTTYKFIENNVEGMIPFGNKDTNFLKDTDDNDLTKRNLEQFNSINYSNYYNNVRDQVNCGGCWAFAVTGSIEGNKSIFLGRKADSLSPQNLIDCDPLNKGCNGGDMRTSFTHIKSKGVMNDADYPLKGYTSSCMYNYLAPLTYISGFNYCSNKTIYKCSTSIVYSLLSKGPLSVLLDGGSNSFQNYKSGIFTGICSEINHAATLVGYGQSGIQNYWLVRNSWSSYWGENGYIRVAVNSQNNYSCFIEFEAILPIMK